MDWKAIECPTCGARYRYLLNKADEQHLRQCSDCDHWFIAHSDVDDSERELRIEPLEHPPACPVDSCEEVVSPAELPSHIIDTHDGSLV